MKEPGSVDVRDAQRRCSAADERVRLSQRAIQDRTRAQDDLGTIVVRRGASSETIATSTVWSPA